MARIRTIKPEFWIDEKIVELTLAARLLFIAVWNFADDQGYLDDKPRRIKMQVFPGDDIDVEAVLDELVGTGLLDRYDSPIGPVLHVRNWSRHQRIDRPASPRFDASSLSPRRGFDESSTSVPVGLATEGKGREGSENTCSPAAPASVSDAPRSSRAKFVDSEEFIAFWAVYPRKVGKPSARKAFAAAIKGGADPAVITAAAASYSADF
jgi:hypothetical protein